MALLHFPSERIVGTLDWVGSWSDANGPVLAVGDVLVPDGIDVALDVAPVTENQSRARADLDFLRDLPPDALRRVTITWANEQSFEALSHLAPGLQHLALANTGFTDAVLPTIATLTHVTFLQTWGNAFTDEGVQVLAALAGLERLYLEEASLSAAAFAFVDRLPRLTHLGIQDVPLSAEDLTNLRRRLPGVRVDD